MILRIVSWEKYNPRKDVKHTTWFRVENTFWSDPAIFRLNNDGKMVWMVLLSLASQRMSGLIEVDRELISGLLKVTIQFVDKTLNDLKVSGKIEIATSRRRNGHVPPTTDGRTDERTDVQESASLDLLAIWNANRGSLAEGRLTPGRRKQIAVRTKDHPDSLYWVEVVKRLARSSFATGKSDSGWRADFGWLIKNDENHVKVSEGKYDDRTVSSSPPVKKKSKNAPPMIGRADEVLP